jgi:hypothetical protein
LILHKSKKQTVKDQHSGSQVSGGAICYISKVL